MLKIFFSNFLFLPKFFIYFSYFYINKKKIRPYFGSNIFKIGGPYIRTKRMIRIFGNHIFSPNIIYAQSYWTLNELRDAIVYSQKKKIPIIFNQNGWFYPGWYKNYKIRNDLIIKIQKLSSLVLYQSMFCKKASWYLNKFIAKNGVIQFNDVPNFNLKKKSKKNYFLLSGVFSENSEHIIMPALKSFELLLRSSYLKKYKYKLIISGIFDKSVKKAKWYKKYLKLSEYLINKKICEFRGCYSENNFDKQFDDISFKLHLRYNDACPNSVIESIKKGLIHIYSDSGGTPELVRDSGIKIKVKKNYNKIYPVNYKLLSKKIIQAIKNKRQLYKKTLIRRKKFDYITYINNHKKYFKKVLSKN